VVVTTSASAAWTRLASRWWSAAHGVAKTNSLCPWRSGRKKFTSSSQFPAELNRAQPEVLLQRSRLVLRSRRPGQHTQHRSDACLVRPTPQPKRNSTPSASVHLNGALLATMNKHAGRPLASLSAKAGHPPTARSSTHQLPARAVHKAVWDKRLHRSGQGGYSRQFLDVGEPPGDHALRYGSPQFDRTSRVPNYETVFADIMSTHAPNLTRWHARIERLAGLVSSSGWQRVSNHAACHVAA